MEEKLICKICGYHTTSRRSMTLHLRNQHKLDHKTHYDKYFKQPNEGFCKVCGKPTKFGGLWVGYSIYCSPGCIPKDPDIQEKMKQTGLKRYGTEYPFQSEDVKEKCKCTMMKKYGYESYLQTPECREIVAENSS